MVNTEGHMTHRDTDSHTHAQDRIGNQFLKNGQKQVFKYPTYLATCRAYVRLGPRYDQVARSASTRQ